MTLNPILNNSTDNLSGHVFISYARDASHGQQLTEALHNELLNTGIPVFRDVGGINPGADWADTLEQAVRRSVVLILVLSPKVTDSKWVRREFNLAESLGLHIIPLLAEAMPLPWWMTDYQLVDFSAGADWERLIPFVQACFPAAPEVAEAGQPAVPAWAECGGQDQFGHYADLPVGGVTQRLRLISAEGAEFWMADTACTQALWQAVTGKNPAEFQGDLQRPVERVSWQDVQGFLGQLNRLVTGLQARLPDEAEWELACRAGSTADTHQVHVAATETVAVKSLPPDASGLYGLCGNVWEWCADDADRWGNQKVLRGGCWALGAELAGCEARGQSAVGNRDYTIGFRFVV